MARLKRRRNPFGLAQAKYKTGASNGGFGTSPGTVAKGSCLTPSANGEVALAGANDAIIGFLVEVDTDNGLVKYQYDYEIKDIATQGTITVGSSIVGNSDTASLRGKAKAAGASQGPEARWRVISSTAGKATVVP